MVKRQRESVEWSGENSPVWKGGQLYYYGPNWRQQRRNARYRDKYTCQHCGLTEVQLGKQLDVHHIVPFRKFGPKKYRQANRLRNLISLCPACHLTDEHRQNNRPNPVRQALS